MLTKRNEKKKYAQREFCEEGDVENNEERYEERIKR